MLKIQLQYHTESLVWGRKENEISRTETIRAGERFWVWDTAEEEGGVRFSLADPYGFSEHYEAEEFFLREGEKRAIRGVKRSVCAEDCVEDIVEGTAELLSQEDGEQ